MDSLIDPFEELKISALSKSIVINSFVSDTTIGPNRTSLELNNCDETTQTDSKQLDISEANGVVVHNHTVTNTSVVNQLLIELETQRKKEVQEALNSRINNICEFTKKQSLITKQQTSQRRLLLLQQEREKEDIIFKSLEEYDKNMLAQQKQIAQHYQMLAEKRKQNTLKLEEYERRKQIMQMLVEKMNKHQREFCAVYQKIVGKINSCSHSHQLRDSLSDILQELKHLPDRMVEIISRCKTRTFDETDCQKLEQLVKDTKDLQSTVESRINAINNEQTTAPAPQPPPPSQPTPAPQPTAAPAEVPHQPKQEPANINNIGNIINKYVSNDSLTYYTNLQDFAENCQRSFNSFVQNADAKKLRFNFQKAINTPVNAISAVNQYHLLDKYTRLSNLLSGQRVVVGETTVSVKDHPEGVLFCYSLLAKKFVLQGDLNISANPKSAFHYAAVAISLWNDFPDFGKLLLAEFHRQCPYLVPIYFPRTVGETDEEFYSKLGYQYKDNLIEKQEKFLKRVSGIMRLYSAMIITKPKKSQRHNPLGYIEGWRWLSAFLNLEPKPDITATMLHIFLENCGFLLQKVYGNVFCKIVNFIYHVYLPAVEKIDNGGPVSRLKTILEDYRRLGEFDKPDGMLPPNFW